MHRRTFVIALAGAMLVGPAAAQDVPTGAAPEAIAAAARPGDDTMTCAQIGAEMAPYNAQIQTIATAGAQQMRSQMPPPGGTMAVNAASAVLGMIPGVGEIVGIATTLAMQHQASQMAAAPGRVQASTNDLMGRIHTFMVDNPRFERLGQMSQERRCDAEDESVADAAPDAPPAASQSGASPPSGQSRNSMP